MARRGRCGSHDPRCASLQGRMTSRYFLWPEGAVCADVVLQDADPQQTLWNGYCPHDGTPIALHDAPDDVDGYVFTHHWWECQKGHTFRAEYDRGAQEYAPAWEGEES